MGKKRVNSDPTRRRSRVDPSTERVQPTISTSGNQRGRDNSLFFAIFTAFSVVTAAVSILIYRHATHSTYTATPYVYRRGLVKANVDYQEILTEHSSVSENGTVRHFSNPVLAYITPWNSAGYDLAKRFNSKFTHLSPVWYNLKGQGIKLVLEGRHDADRGWMSELRQKGNAQILPRFVLEAEPKDLLRKKKQRDKAIDLIITECRDMDYDGVVLESWSRWYGVLHDAAMRKMALQFIKQLGDALHNVSSNRSGKYLQLVYVIGPPRSENPQPYDFGPVDLQILNESVDGFSLMTYDYSSPYSPGPNAPLKWVHSTLELLSAGSKSLANKIFIGINFYGYDYLMAEGLGEMAMGCPPCVCPYGSHVRDKQWNSL
uniref:Chitinase domain-containing protein 1 n=1 Tax=Opuntia streptacantha TaxID=393608 RepID=A0A7C9DC39_OPUST